MELATPESIQLLMHPQPVPAHVRRRRADSGAGRPGRTRRCQCGKCVQCLENARWERIFAEKFADPTYYTRPLVTVRSPLTSI